MLCAKLQLPFFARIVVLDIVPLIIRNLLEIFTKYASLTHFLKDWKRHKLECKALTMVKIACIKGGKLISFQLFFLGDVNSYR